MNRFKGKKMEHGPSGKAGLCIDEWVDPTGEWALRISLPDYKSFNCWASDCRPARFKPYLITTNYGERVQ